MNKRVVGLKIFWIAPNQTSNISISPYFCTNKKGG
jgi:hypothetical protein